MKVYTYIKNGGVIFILCMGSFVYCNAQKSIIDLFKSDQALANRYLRKGELQEAIRLYERSNKSGKAHVMLARVYFQLKEYSKCVDAYDHYLKSVEGLDRVDYFRYAEANLVLKNYEQAQESYQKMVELEPGDWVMKKIWRISNMHYLYDDSIHFATRSLSINTTNGEWGGVPIQDGILFLSNRAVANPVKEVDAATHQSFYKMYTAIEKPDTLLDGWSMMYVRPGTYGKAPAVNGNAGRFALYDSGGKMVFAASSTNKGPDGFTNLGLYFAELREGKWKLTHDFAHNSTLWSTTDPSIDDGGSALYFSSDKSGGMGGMDIYRSEWINSQWTEPVNLGGEVNTPMDEVFPYFQGNTLYFSSNGHAGMGGLDLFKIEMTASAYGESVNLGYPINSTYDDFAITFTDENGNHGFLSSNRKRGGLDDDIYEFDMDMQAYPFTITGVIKQMNHSWSDSTQANILRNARILLVDNVRKVIARETTSDEDGSFSLTIPYFSKYGIHVFDPDGAETVVALDIPRQRKESLVHEIVVVKDIFQTVNK